MNPTTNVNELIDQAKKSGHKVMKTSIGGTSFIYMNYLRSEWKEIQKLISEKSDTMIKADPNGIGIKEAGEDIVVSHALIPAPTADYLGSLPAGTITALADLILRASGFGQEEQTPEEL